MDDQGSALSRTILDDLAALPKPERQAILDAIEEMRSAAFLQGYLTAHLWLAMWRWRYNL